MATHEIMADLAELARRQETGGHSPPPSPSRSEEIAEHLIRGEGARPMLAGILADMVVNRCRWPVNGGSPSILTAGGQPDPGATMADLLADLRKGFPECFAGGPVRESAPTTPPVAKPSSKYAPSTMTARALAERDARQATAKAEAETVNPYAAATRNITRQAVMERDDPARAARLRSEAGG